MFEISLPVLWPKSTPRECVGAIAGLNSLSAFTRGSYFSTAYFPMSEKHFFTYFVQFMSRKKISIAVNPIRVEAEIYKPHKIKTVIIVDEFNKWG